MVENDISTANPVKNYKAFVSVDKRGQFEIALTKILGTKLGGRKTNMLSVKAKSLEYSTLKDSMDVLRRICSLDEAKMWIEWMVSCKKPCYLVIGIQTLCEAELKRVVFKEGGVGGSATMPLDASWQIPVHVQGGVSTEDFGSSVSVESGVFGIEVQRLHSQIDSMGYLKPTSVISWEWSYKSRRKSFHFSAPPCQRKEMLEIRLEDVEVDELIKPKHSDNESDKEEKDI